MNKKMKNSLLVTVFSALALVACADIPQAAYQTRGNPETLLDSSSERVSFGLGTPGAADDVTAWINKDRPARAELACAVSDPACYAAIDILRQYGIPYKDVASRDGGNSVALIYQKTMARDCDNRYVDNHDNSDNLNHPTFGCSIAVNTVQMVTNRKEFLDPALRDPSDAAKSDAAYQSYMMKKPPAGPTVTVENDIRIGK